MERSGTNPNINVTPGERLFLVFDAFSYPASGRGVIEATQFGGSDKYVSGEFVFFNALGQADFAAVNATAWSHRFGNGEDLGILASFTNDGVAVPAPTPRALILLNLAGIGISRMRKES